MKVIISNDPAALEAALAKYSATATVEAEYGDTVVTGSALTLAHHGSRSARPCPCSLCNFPDFGIEAVGISHVDLDTLGGLLAIMGERPALYMWVNQFWDTAAQVDIQGAHKLPQIGFGDVASDMVEESLNAWWAFSESPAGRVFAPRDGSAVEVDLSEHIRVLKTLLVPVIIEDDDDVYKEDVDWDTPARLQLVEAGRQWAASKDQLDQDSLVRDLGSVLLRTSGQFCNHLYRSAKAVVAFNETQGSVTVSLADPIPGVSCRELVQALWGSEAGGHDGIAGSPRGLVMTMADAEALARATLEAIEPSHGCPWGPFISAEGCAESCEKGLCNGNECR